MYVSVASTASLSSQNLSKFGSASYGGSVKRIEAFEKDTMMMKTATTPRIWIPYTAKNSEPTAEQNWTIVLPTLFKPIHINIASTWSFVGV